MWKCRRIIRKNELIKTFGNIRISGRIGIRMHLHNCERMHKQSGNTDILYRNDRDTFRILLSQMYRIIDKHLIDNDQRDISVLIVTGGWIESFYLLCQTYNNYKSKEIRDLIFQQKFVLENLIKGLAPYYESSAEMQDVIDNLVELAYNFDLLDFKYTYENPVYQVKQGVMVFNNDCHVINSPESLETIIKTIEKIRKKVIS